jgi:hypothetical protein
MDMVKLISAFAGANAPICPRRSAIISCVLNRVLDTELRRNDPSRQGVSLLLQWGATAFASPMPMFPPNMPGLAILEEHMLRVTRHCCPTQRARRLLQPKQQEHKQQEQKQQEQKPLKQQEPHELLAMDPHEGCAADLPCSHVYFAARAKFGDHFPCAVALLRAKCYPLNAFGEGPQGPAPYGMFALVANMNERVGVCMRNALSAAIANPNPHAANIARLLHVKHGVMDLGTRGT